MNRDPGWDNKIELYNPLTLLKLIEKKYWLRTKINIVMQQCAINSVHCMDPINTTRPMEIIIIILVLRFMLDKLLV